MAILQLDVVAKGLDKIKKSLEGINIGGNSKGTGKKKEGGGLSGLKGLAILGGMLGVLVGVLSNLESVTGILGVISGLINSLVAPFVPILIGLIKPVFILLSLFLSKVLKTLGVGQKSEGGLLPGADKIPIALAGIAGALTAVAVVIAGGPTLLIAALATLAGLVVLVISGFLNDFARNLANAVHNYIVEPLSTILANAIKALDSFFGTNFGELLFDAVKTGIEVLRTIWGGIGLLLTGQFAEGFAQMGLAFDTLIGGLKRTFFGIINNINRVLQTFQSLFIRALNFLIGIINKVPGINVGKIGESGRSLNTNIEVNIQGDASESTVDKVISALRSKINLRGAF